MSDELLSAFSKKHPNLQIDPATGKIRIEVTQPIEGVPIAQVGDRFEPYILPSYDKKVSDDVFEFYYAGPKAAAKLTIDTKNRSETLTEISLKELNELIASEGDG